jgi:hypothetical protein
VTGQVRTHRSGIAVTIALFLLLLWNWQLLLALGMGAIALVTVYLGQQGQLNIPRQWQTQAQHWVRLCWKPSNRPLSVAIAAATFTAFSTYLSLGIWVESDHPWFAFGLILQGFGTVAILLLLLRRKGDRNSTEDFSIDPASHPTNFHQNFHLNFHLNFHQWLNDLSEADPLKRLIAVRQLSQCLSQDARSSQDRTALPMTPAHLSECFRLMLNRETDPLVCAALLEGLQVLGQGRQLRQSRRGAIAIPTQPTADPVSSPIPSSATRTPISLSDDSQTGQRDPAVSGE